MFYGTMKESRRKATALQGGGGKRGKVQTAFISSGTRTSTPCCIFHHLEPILRFALKQHTKKAVQTPPSSAKPILTIILLRDFSFKFTQLKTEF
jgi:hypothetical protein